MWVTIPAVDASYSNVDSCILNRIVLIRKYDKEIPTVILALVVQEYVYKTCSNLLYPKSRNIDWKEIIMIRRFLRSYGLLIVCSLGILGGLLMYQNYKTDVLEYSLDTVGDRLLSLTPEGPSREAVVAMYSAFKERVLAREVSPDQVEHVAANILNLNNSGASVTPEQAEAMLDMPMLATTAQDSTSVRIASHYEGDPVHFVRLGERLRSVVDFDTHMRTMIDEDPEHRREMRRRMRYECEDGIRVAVDAQMAELIPENDFRVLRSELRLLEAGKMVVWKENLAEEMAEVRRRVRVDLDAISVLQDLPFPGFLKEIKQLKALKGLEGHNYHFDERKLKDVIAKSMRTMEKDLKQMKEDLKDIPGVSGKSKS